MGGLRTQDTFAEGRPSSLFCKAGIWGLSLGAIGQFLNSHPEVSPEAALRRIKLPKMSPGDSKRLEHRLPE